MHHVLVQLYSKTCINWWLLDYLDSLEILFNYPFFGTATLQSIRFCNPFPSVKGDCMFQINFGNPA